MKTALGIVALLLTLVGIAFPFPLNLFALGLSLLLVSVGALFGGIWLPIAVLWLGVASLAVSPFTLAFLLASGWIIVMVIVFLMPIVAIVLRSTGRLVLGQGSRGSATILQRIGR